MKGWAESKGGGLTLVLTRRCPVRCGFCPQSFEDKDMSVPVLSTAMEAFGRRFGSLGPVKLFGGEPLVVPDLIRQAVLSAKALGLKGGILLSTHGRLMDEAMVRFLRAHPEVEVAFGRPSGWTRKLPSVTLNFLLEPGKKVETVLATARGAMAMGHRSFNILPAYFVPWSAPELAELERSLAALSRLFSGLASAGLPVDIKNLRRQGSVPLYNDGPCVDTDGSVYASNLVLAAGMKPHLARLRLGHVDAPKRLAPPPSAAVMRSVLEKSFSKAALEGTWAADALLTEFVHGLR
ncbi:MAG: radical SAM protein [Elusimicrobiota bacterium]|jgi:hypothetical protein